MPFKTLVQKCAICDRVLVRIGPKQTVVHGKVAWRPVASQKRKDGIVVEEPICANRH